MPLIATFLRCYWNARRQQVKRSPHTARPAATKLLCQACCLHAELAERIHHCSFFFEQNPLLANIVFREHRCTYRLSEALRSRYGSRQHQENNPDDEGGDRPASEPREHDTQIDGVAGAIVEESQRRGKLVCHGKSVATMCRRTSVGVKAM